MLSSRVDEIDVQIEKIHRLIENGTRDDPELGAGLGTGEALASVQRKVDQAAAACETLDGHLRDLARQGL
jgi:hypothetical protein